MFAKPTAILLAATLALCAPTAGMAEFSPAEAKLYVGWPGLEGVDFPQGAEAKVYSIIDNMGGWPRPVYVVMLDNGRALSPVGTMQCEVTFQVLKDQHHGWHDILCENSGWSEIWKMGSDGLYAPR
ncbi:hypothetical protein C8J27_10757 [Rhodobacter aestuarii]|uniref:Uncharacterized protein n=1 Tax=Rhodobacter aestuarii TaxID=453582 RepID=A0A1N7NVM0_9RHOB|nr:hypothetical protein [Rhodobacter aestuarii]PTV94526.1 hypothetical protein C8J27_10757 [Rhodobacter aestuarii]SIT02326.1 hypothetical protein SAMN05421580_108170 [Rhodobacter aestuarii]